MVQRFARLLFDFACKLAQSLPVCQHTFLFANRWGTHSHQNVGGTAIHGEYLEEMGRDLKSPGHHVM